MSVIAWVRDNPLGTLVCFLLVATLTAASWFGVVVWSVAALATGGASVPFQLLFLLLLGAMVVGSALTVASLVGLVYGLLSRAWDAAAAAGREVARGAEAVERRSPLARVVGLSDLTGPVDPRSRAAKVEDRLDRVKARYVEGELSMAEFERRIRDVLGEERVGHGGVSTGADGGHERAREYER